jgi:hypothetical protein
LNKGKAQTTAATPRMKKNKSNPTEGRSLCIAIPMGIGNKKAATAKVSKLIRARPRNL